MMFTAIIGAATIALGPCNAYGCDNSQISTPRVIEINAHIVRPNEINRRQDRFSDHTRGEVIGVVRQDGQVEWPSSDRESLRGQDGPAQIYIQMFDGVFAIDPFQPLPAANDATAKLLFRGTSLETDRTQFGRQRIDRTKELFSKLEQARIDWLRDNGYYNARTFTRSGTVKRAGEAKLPEPAATFRRPVDVPRLKSREQVNADSNEMGSVASVMNSGKDLVRVSLPMHMQTARKVSAIQRNAPKPSEEVAINE